MEFRINTVTTPSFNNGQSPRRRMILDNLSKFPDRGARFDYFNSHIQGLTCSFNESDRIWVRFGFVAHVIGFVQVSMVSTVVD